MYPETAEIQENGEEEEQLAAFAEQVRKRQKELAETVENDSFSPFNLTGCERVQAELFTTNDKACFTIDKNGIVFNSFARKKLSGNDTVMWRIWEQRNSIPSAYVRLFKRTEPLKKGGII